jgi:hypothetical protein
MRVYTNRNSIVDLKHFRYCTKHYGMLLALQHEAPNLKLEVAVEPGRSTFIPIHELNFDDYLAVNRLNPSDPHST